jgi:hypothetical protein
MSSDPKTANLSCDIEEPMEMGPVKPKSGTDPGPFPQHDHDDEDPPKPATK